MNAPALLVRLESSDQSQIKTIGLAPDGLITIESWRVTRNKPKADLQRRTIGSGVYAPLDPTEALAKAVTAESEGYQVQTVLDGRSKYNGYEPNWISYTSLIDVNQLATAKEGFIYDAGLDDDIVFARIGNSVIVFMLKSSGVIWLTESRINAAFDCLTDHTAMTLLGAITMSIFSSTSVTGSGGGDLTELRKCINPRKLSEAMRELGAKAKLFAIPMKFTKQLAAVW